MSVLVEYSMLMILTLKRLNGVTLFSGITPQNLKDFIQEELDLARKEEREEIKKKLPKELGFDDYDKHMHSYIYENRGNCGICGLSWKKATAYEIYNNAIIQVRRLLKDNK